MSAITGIYLLTNDPIECGQGLEMMNALQQYPADDSGIWQRGPVFFGCHAQWIAPESIREPLPFFEEQSRMAITADAMIDNRDELFDKLQINREVRTGMPDSQLILRAYQKWGEACPEHLIGDFAFMIWDERKRQLFGARDFSGSRTLYYVLSGQQFAFCTVIEPLFAFSGIERVLNEQWLAEFLAISGMIDVGDASMTAYQKIRQLPPSHSIVVSGGQARLIRYCTLDSIEQLKLKSGEDYIEAFQEVFTAAVRSRLRTFRKMGAQLSGGLDSGSIVGFAAKELRKVNKPLHTFSYIPPQDFEDFTPRSLMADETPYIKSTVAYIGDITDHYCNFQGRDSYTEIDDFLAVMEMPYKFFENSFWLKGMFEQAHAAGVGILLNGGRGNLSISWGSAIDYFAILLKKLRWVRLAQELNQYSQHVGGSRYRNLPVVAREAFPLLNRMFPQFDQPEFPMLINPEFASRTDVFNKLRDYGMDQSGWFSAGTIYQQRKRHFTDVFHWNASNTISAKLSLRYSLWKRDPTNDLRVIRFCLSLPEEQYVQNGWDRALIRRAAKNYLPDKVRLNQRIRGVQGADWVHRMIPFWDLFLAELEQLAADEMIMDYLNPGTLSRALAKARTGPRAEYAIDPDFKILMRSLIVYRFIKTALRGGDKHEESMAAAGIGSAGS